MKNEYNKEIEKIHAPKELIKRTKIEMKKELEKQQPTKKKITVTVILRISALAAIVVLIIGGYTYYSSQNHIEIAEVEQTNFNVNKKLGRVFDKEQSNKIQMAESKDPKIIPEFLKEVKISKIKGNEVQLGKDSNGDFYGAFKKKDNYYYITGKDVLEEVFIDFIKNKL